MFDSKPEGDDHALELSSLTIHLPNPGKPKEAVVVDSVPSEEIPLPTAGDFPDGGLTAWLVVVGVRTTHDNLHYTLTSGITVQGSLATFSTLVLDHPILGPAVF